LFSLLFSFYFRNPQLNAERARQRGTDEGVPQALSGYRPQLLATLTGGLQSLNGSLQLFAVAGTSGHVFTNGTMADLLVTRDASGLFSAYVNGNLAFSVMDMNGATRFSGPDNIIYFFMDDFVSLTNYPDLPEAGTGFVDRIQVTTFPAVQVPGPVVGAGLPGLILASGGLLGWWRRRQKTA